MNPAEHHPLESCLRALQTSWQEYRQQSTFEHYVEFTLSIDSVTDKLGHARLPGLQRLCEGLENTALALFGDESTHPITEQDLAKLQRQLDTVVQACEATQPERETARELRRSDTEPSGAATDWARPRAVWLISEASHAWVAGLTEQLGFFGFRVHRCDWAEAAPADSAPLVILFIPPPTGYGARELARVRELRGAQAASQLFCLGLPKSLDIMVDLLRAGADATIDAEQQTLTVLGRVLDLIQSEEQEAHRVLVVEDSPTAVATIQRALTQHGIGSEAISNPQDLLGALERYRPDIVLMDMYMPHCTGVEATRVLRQLPHYQSLPVVYLSSETDMAMQVEALRLGGDQFLTKPFNPVFLAAVVKTKIERYREMQRSSQHDSLTGLLNHSTTKSRLNQLLAAMQPARNRLCVAMLDIDHFKSINDTYGHPVGDQVIRSLAWLLKGRLRGSDIIGRYGGEEFLVVLPNAGLDEAQVVLERIRRDFATLPHAHTSGTLRSTFSAGVAAYPALNSGSDLTHAADEALLQAKRLGRNRIERAG